MVEKSRLTIDLREINKILPSASWPLPHMDDFRQKCAEKGFKIFSNFDCSTFYHQIMVDPQCAAENFNFHALGRVYTLLRLAMGCKNSPAIAQATNDKIFRSHAHCAPFLDDLTVYSRTMDEHINIDLPKMLALSSHYNLLLKPSKADIGRRECRILGHNVAEELLTLSPEKIEKIADMAFPTDKKDLISKLAFLQWFCKIVPRLSELTGPLRRLALPSVRFQPTDEHRRCFEAAKQHLLDKKVNVIRMPSPKLEDAIILFVDASSHSISGLLTQMLHPIGKTSGPKFLYIIGAYSQVLKPGQINHPIWLLELLSLYEATRKFMPLIASRQLICVTDSKVVSSWASLDLVPRDIARRILSLQRFNCKIVFLES